MIDLWNVNITAGETSALIYVTSSISPHPFIITDDPNPQSKPGITHPPVTRTITPPPYPYTTNRPTDHPHLTHSSGAPQHPCKIGCGHKCFGLFCLHPCLLGCSPKPPGFHDPIDPNPDNSPDNPDPDDPDQSQTSCTQTSTVADYYVSCATSGSNSASCTTTSSEVVKGCHVTATAITTGGGSCPTASPQDDQGQDGDPPGEINGTPVFATSTKYITVTPSPPPRSTVTIVTVVTPTPAPEPTRLAFNIGYPNGCQVAGHQGGGTLCTNTWKVFTGFTYAPCEDKPVFNGASYQGDSPKYPVRLGPFDGNGLSDCTYTSPSSTDGGSMSCGAATGICVVAHRPADCSGEDSLGPWDEQAVCTFEG